MIKGIRSADGESSLFKELKKEGMVPISIIKTTSQKGKIKISVKEARSLASIMHLLLEAGHSISDTLTIIVKTNPSKNITMICRIWEEEVKRGVSFQDAIENSSIQLPPGFCAFAKIGQKTGSLAAVLKELEIYYERMGKFREKLTMATIYPAFVVFVAICAGLFLSIVAIPKLQAELVSVFPNETVLPTLGLYPKIIILGILSLFTISILIFFLPFGQRKDRNILRFSHFVLHLPFLGLFLTHWALLQWIFAIEVLSKAKVPLNLALLEAAPAAGNKYLVSILENLSDQLKKGETLGRMLENVDHIPPVLSTWLSVGEEVGGDTDIYSPIRKYFEERVSRFIDLAIQLIEPAIIIIVGVGLIIFILIFILPVFEKLGQIR